MVSEPQPRRTVQSPVLPERGALPEPAPGKRELPTRLPLGVSRRKLSYDRRLRLWLSLLVTFVVACLGGIAWMATQSGLIASSVVLGAALLGALGAATLFEQITRPLQTLSNVVAALREDDFSFRARGARRSDSLGDLALEINTLAGTLQTQRGAARDALTLAERVMDAMQTPVLAFSAEGTLRLLNPAAASTFGLTRGAALGRKAHELGLEELWGVKDGVVHEHPAVSGIAGETRWSVRRSVFRLGGVPHHLFVLSDVQAALREEERIAWQRLVRVLSHEINNSLTPISSIAGSLSARFLEREGSAGSRAFPQDTALDDLRRGLHLIEDRALSLHRFLQAYQQLARLPPPTLTRVALLPLVERVIGLETRLHVHLLGGPDVILQMDPAQIEQLLINLLRNAVDAALSAQTGDHPGQVAVFWSRQASELLFSVEDNGPGLTESGNLFVPFYTTKPGGNGIGLALAKQIAAGHHGTLTLGNKPDGGCLAALHLPLV